jgi:anti-sigma B factor antagonist
MTMLRRVDTPNPAPDPATFAIVKRELDERTNVLSIEGELDLSTAPRLKWMLIDSLEAGTTQLVVDLSLATFMDSTALGVLVGVNRRLDPGARLAIVCTRDNVLKVFEFSGTDGAFAIYQTLDEGLAHARGQTAPIG